MFIRLSVVELPNLTNRDVFMLVMPTRHCLGKYFHYLNVSIVIDLKQTGSTDLRSKLGQRRKTGIVLVRLYQIKVNCNEVTGSVRETL